MDIRLTSVSSILLAGPVVFLAQPSFTGLGDLPGGTVESGATGIAAGGLIVVGWSVSSNGTEAFRWTPGDGMVGLGDLPGGTFFSIAADCSEDGRTVVGRGTPGGASAEAFRWGTRSGMLGLGFLPGGAKPAGEALDVSGDENVVVGWSTSSNGVEAFTWTFALGMVGIGDLGGGAFDSVAFGTSSNGSVIVGRGSSALGYEAFRWTSVGGMVGLGDLPGGGSESAALDVSGDGLVVVGYGSSAAGMEAFRWTQATGMQGLGDLPGGAFSSQALGVNGDGSVVVGMGSTASGQEAFVWKTGVGMRNLKSVLYEDYGIDVGSWRLTHATAVDPIGTAVAGQGVNPAGQQEAWLAVMPPFEVVNPTSFSVTRGSLAGGGLGDLFASDDSRLLVREAPVTSAGLPAVQVQFEGTIPPVVASGLRFKAELSCTAMPVGSVLQTVELFDFLANVWVVMSSRAAWSSDVVVNVGPSGDPSRYIQAGSGRLLARVSWYDSGILFMPAWLGQIDQAVWHIL